MHAEGDQLIFERRYGNERILILMTRGAPLKHELSGIWTDLISKEPLEGAMEIASAGVRILKQTV